MGKRVRDILVAHALAEGADRAEDVGVRIGRDERFAGADEAFVDRDVRADTGVDVVDAEAVLAGEQPALLLVAGVALVRPAGVAVEGEERPVRVGDAQPVVDQVLDDVRAAEVAGDAGVDRDVHHVAGGHRPSGVVAEDLLNNRLAHD